MSCSTPDATTVPAQASASLGYSIAPVTSDEELATLEQDWNRLSESAELPNIFMTFDWFRTWNQGYACGDRSGQRRLQILVLKKGGAITGISPLVYTVDHRGGLSLRKVRFLEIGADYSDLVVGNDLAGQAEAVMDFLAQTRDQWDIVDLTYLRDAGDVFPAIERALLSHPSSDTLPLRRD